MEKDTLEKQASLLFSNNVSVSFENNLKDFILDKQEEEIISNSSSSKRKKEFKLGRKAAKSALEELSFNGLSTILKGPSGAPIWPAGFTGSITHSGGWAGAAALNNKEANILIGLDLQTVKKEGETSSALNKTLTKIEKFQLEALSNKNDDLYYKLLIFSSKEAIYKALNTNIDFNKDLNWQSINLTPDSVEKNKIISISTMFEESFSEGAKIIKELKCASYINKDYIISGVEATLSDQLS